MEEIDLSGGLRRLRRRADLSQREAALVAGVSKSALARAELGRSDLGVRGMLRLAARAGARLVLVDAVDGAEVVPMDPGAVRDLGGRRFPAHLDTRHGDEHWWPGPHRFVRDRPRPRPWYTFDRSRPSRDLLRACAGTPADHQRPAPGDSPAERDVWRDRLRRERFRARIQAQTEVALQRTLDGLPWPGAPMEDPCQCVPECRDLDLSQDEGPPGALAGTQSRGRPHLAACPCRCDDA